MTDAPEPPRRRHEQVDMLQVHAKVIRAAVYIVARIVAERIILYRPSNRMTIIDRKQKETEAIECCEPELDVTDLIDE